jgi:DNA-binding transcriptional regulator GbsR (MarR family)
MHLSPIQKKFILHWGEMGSRWGINRTVAQVHALLFISPAPLSAEDIRASLSAARSNVHNSLKELLGWGVIRVAHVLGDRRDHFESLKDVWDMFQIVLAERKKREVDPTLRMLRDTVAELAATKSAADAHTKERLEAMLEFFETMTACYNEFTHFPPSTMRKLAKMSGKVGKLLGLGALK